MIVISYAGVVMADLKRIFKALGNDTRLRILKLLFKRGELTVGQVGKRLDLTFSRASRNLVNLESTGLLKSRRERTWIYYTLNLNRKATGYKLLVFLKENLNYIP